MANGDWSNIGSDPARLTAIAAMLGEDSANNSQATTLVAANADGSLVERLEFLQAAASGTAGLASFPAGAAAANDVSLAEVIRYIQENIIVGSGTALPSNASLWGALAGATGVPTWPTAAAYANAVSMAEVLGYIQDAVRNGSGTAMASNKSIADALGSTGSAITRTAGSNIAGEFLALPRCVEKSDGGVLSGADPLFTITGGPIKVLEITGIVTTNIGAGTTNAKLQVVTTTPSATTDMNAAAVDIDADAAGTSYQTINTTGILTPVTAGYVKEANAFATLPTTFLVPIGSIQFTSDAARAGVIKWYLRYVPLSPDSLVVAAA